MLLRNILKTHTHTHTYNAIDDTDFQLVLTFASVACPIYTSHLCIGEDRRSMSAWVATPWPYVSIVEVSTDSQFSLQLYSPPHIN